MKLEKFTLYFPWASVLIAVFLCVYFYMLSTDTTASAYSVATAALIPAPFREDQFKLASLVIFLLVILFDFLVFSRTKREFHTRLQEYDNQVQEILKSKSNLQTKALKYSDHADKLKLFISDRLLEHIEYDEKYLHFKNIASEVRHNGVISYDKVKTALELAMKNDTSHTSYYSDSLVSMRYLWDLLDLSTTDNISIYVANKLYEAEERYCQQVLDDSLKQQNYSPTFYAYDAVIGSLPDFVEKTEIRHIKNKSRRKVVTYSGNQLQIECEKSIQLLGNINYFILLIENLLNNALFYLNKKNYGNKYARISIQLKKSKKHACLSIYNPGPLIDDETRDKIFQLGFSTRRSKENNGKGLGLYFVNQIVKGNEGTITFDNISNKNQTLELSITEENEKPLVETVSITAEEDNSVSCQSPASNGTFLEYKFKNSVTEIKIQTGKDIYSLDIPDSQSEAILFDPENTEYPRWCVEFFKLKTMNKVVFRPLNVTGVRFIVNIPTAESRLEVDYHELESDEINKLENLDVDFDEGDRALYR